VGAALANDSRVAVYRYRFTDLAVRRKTGAWWQRDLERTSRPLAAGTRTP
jgi:hypothetical protein